MAVLSSVDAGISCGESVNLSITASSSSEMRIKCPDDLALPFQGCPVTPQDNDGRSAWKKSPVDPASTRPTNRPKKMSFHRRISSGSTKKNVISSRSGSFYAGPQPTIRGQPLKGCLKNQSRPQSEAPHSVARRVSFGHVQLREYCRQVGDSPSVSSGCPLAIGWKYNKRARLDIDTYEADRDKNPVRCEPVSSKDRVHLLTHVGNESHTHVMQGQVNAYFARQQRAETLDQIGGFRKCESVGPRERLFIMRESAFRKLARVKSGISPDQEQQKLWDVAHEEARRKVADDEARRKSTTEVTAQGMPFSRHRRHSSM